MNYVTSKFSLLVLPTTTLLCLPFLVSADIDEPSGGVRGVALENPLKVSSLEDLLVALLNIVVVLATPIIIFFIIYSGFMYVTAQGEPAKLTIAKNALMYAIIGGVIIIGAVAISQIIGNLVGAFK